MKIDYLNPVATVLFEGTRHGIKWHQKAEHGTYLFALNASSPSFDSWRDSYCLQGMMNEAGMRAAYLAGFQAGKLNKE